MFSQAIKEDSLFTAAYAQRARIHFYIFWNKNKGWPGHDLLGKDDIKRGLKLDHESSDIKFAQAVSYYHIEREYDKALKILNELKIVMPNMADVYAYIGYILRRQGKLEKSIIELKQAIQLDPFNASYRSNLSQTFQLLHQYDNQLECAKQGLMLIPEYKRFRDYIFSAIINKTGDLKGALNMSGLKEDEVWYGSNVSRRETEGDITSNGIFYYNRQYDKLIESIYKDTLIITSQTTYRPKAYELALSYFLEGKTSLCKIYADSAILNLKEKIREIPDDDRFYATLGKCYALSGNDLEAFAYGRKAIELKPISLDTYQGTVKEQDLMEIYIFCGKFDEALDKIEYLLSVPSWLSKGILMIDPIFDPLREKSRFQKILKTDY
jgi:tetratricopeptide (TPR) repeat protein